MWYIFTSFFSFCIQEIPIMFRKSKKYDHITPVLKDLHWLPVKSRIIFRVLFIVHTAMNSDACPTYIQELVTRYAPPRAIRSVPDGMLLSVPSTHRCIVAGDNAFRVCGPRLWNDLPLSLRETQSQTTFKRKLKTHLFNQSSFRSMNFFPALI